MPRGRKAPAISRARQCRKCGADEWRKVTKGFSCVPCDRRRATEARRRERAANPVLAMWNRAKQRAKNAGQRFTITTDDVRAVWPTDGRCPILGVPLVVATNGSAAAGSPSLDRLNPAWGYERGNIAVVSHAANRAKGDMTADDLEKIVQWMRANGLT